MAAQLGVDLKTIKRGVAALSGAPKKPGAARRVAYIEVKFDGYVNGNSYVPNFDASPRMAGGDNMPPGGDNMPPVGGGTIPEGGGKNGPSGGGKNGLLTSLIEHHTNKSRADTADGGDPSAARWLSVKNRLRIALSPAVVSSWFEQADLVSLTSTEVVLCMRSRFARSHVENNHLGQHLTDAWRAELGAHVNVRLVDPIVRAAE